MNKKINFNIYVDTFLLGVVYEYTPISEGLTQRANLIVGIFNLYNAKKILFNFGDSLIYSYWDF